jgi:hypothetical protein
MDSVERSAYITRFARAAEEFGTPAEKYGELNVTYMLILTELMNRVMELEKDNA